MSTQTMNIREPFSDVKIARVTLMMTLGVQTVFGSFFLSILGLRRT